MGAYVVKITSHSNTVTILASGSEVELALDVQASLKKNNIESKVVSMPCQELFDKQTDHYKKDILDEETLLVAIEAGDTSSWKKYVGKNGLVLGINKFGESAPYKQIYDHLNLSVGKIVNTIQKKLRN